MINKQINTAKHYYKDHNKLGIKANNFDSINYMTPMVKVIIITITVICLVSFINWI